MYFFIKILSNNICRNSQLLRQGSNLCICRSFLLCSTLFESKSNLNFSLKNFRAKILFLIHKIIMCNYSKTDYY